MIERKVVFSPEAAAQLVQLRTYIARAASADIAVRYSKAVVTFCEGLSVFPDRGRPRFDVRPGLRTLGFQRTVLVAYDVTPDTVAILGVFYGGQDFEAAFLESGQGA